MELLILEKLCCGSRLLPDTTLIIIIINTLQLTAEGQLLEL